MSIAEINKELAKSLQSAKKKPRNFAIIAKGANVLDLLVDKKPIKEGTLVKAKKECQGNIIVKGVVSGNGPDLVFQVTEAPSIGEPKLKKFITETTGLTLKARFEVVSGLEEVDDDLEEGVEDNDTPESPSSELPESPPPPPPSPQDDLAIDQLKSAMAKLVPHLQRAITASPEREGELLELAKAFQQHVKSGDPTAAKESLLSLGKLVNELLGAKSTETAPPPEPPPESPRPQAPDTDYKEALRRIGPLLKEAARANIAPKDKDQYRSELVSAGQLREQGDISAAVEKLNTLERRVRLALEQANASPEGKERGDKRLRDKVALERERAEKELLAEAALNTLPGGLDFSPIRAILNEHKQALPKEEKALDEFEFLDEMLTNRKLKEDPALMKQKLEGIGSAMAAAYGRQKRLADELRKLPRPGDDAPDEEKQAYKDAWLLPAEMVAHIPEHWQAQWSPNFSKRIANLIASPEDKARNLEAAKNAFSEEDRQRHREVLKRGIEANSTRKLDRVEFYFDRLIKAPSPQELQDLARIQQEVMEVGTKILDSGGKLSDVRAALKHIPESWWPPAFVDYLQAWRKTEREMQRLRVAEMFAETDYLQATLDGISGVTSLISTLGGIASPLTDKFLAEKTDDGKGGKIATPEWLKVEGVEEAIATFASTIQNGVGMGQDVGKALAREFIERENEVIAVFKDPVKMEATAAKLLEMTKTTAGLIGSALKAYGKIENMPSNSMLMSQVLPGIAIAVAGVDLYLAIRTLAKHARRLHVTKTMIPEAELDWARGLDEDGGAFVRALGNEVSARKLQISKDSVNTVEKGLNLGGAIAGSTGDPYGKAAQLGLMITGKVITYGGKIVFTNIEWSRANTAKKLIAEARAGNPSARIELMSDCGLYAKMYIAILAREGHPKALKFIADRGIEESDLEGGALAMKIVVDEMLKDADQPDETKIADNWLEANLTGLGLGGAISLGRKVVGGVKSIVDAIRTIPKSSRDIPYDEQWRHKQEHVALTAAAWEAGKNEAKQAGLFDYSTGIGSVFTKVEAAYTNLSKAKTEEEKTSIIAVLDRLDELYGALIGYEPVTNPQGEDEKYETHRGMVLYLADLKSHIMSERSKFEGLLVSQGHKDANWTTDKSSLLPDEWKATFQEAAEKACLTDDDAGVGKALAAYHKAATDPEMADNNSDPQKRRKALLKAYDAGTELLAALDDLYGSARECEGLRAYIDRLKGLAAGQMRTWDEQLVTVLGREWVCPSTGAPSAIKFSADGWKATWDQAVEDGVVSEGKKDGGVHDALTEAESARATLDKIDQQKDPKDKRKARYEYQRKLAHVFASARKCSDGQKHAVQSFKDYAAEVGKWAQEQIQATRDEQGDVKFTVVPGFDAKSFAQTDDNAKAAGAVGSSGGRMKKLENAIKDTVAAEAAFLKASEKQDRAGEREAAADRKKALEKVGDAVEDALTAEGYAENKQMKAYLEGLKTEAQKRLGVTVYQQVLEGSSMTAEDFDPGAFQWEDGAWQKVKKQTIAAGLIKDSKTGFGAALTEAKEKYDTWTSAKPSEKIATADDVRKSITRARGLAETLAASTAHPKLKAYFNQCVTFADQMLNLVQADETSEFNPPPFAWSNSAWQKVKKEAVTRGLMKDEATGFGDALKEAKELYDEWQKLKPAEKVDQREAVEKKVVKARNIAANYRDTVEHAKLSDYFKQAVTLAEQMLALLKVDGVAGVDFDPGPFEWSDAAWQKMKKQAVAKGILPDTKTNFGETLDKSKKAYDAFTKARDKRDTKKMPKAREEASDLITAARKIASNLQAATDHTKMKAYFERCVSLADQMLYQLPEDIVEFNPPAFEWKSDAWQKVKKEAVALGLLKDDKTGFGGLLDAAYKKFGEFYKASKAKDERKMSATREPARAALVTARQVAEELGDKTGHTKLKAYFKRGVTMAEGMLNLLNQ